MKTTAVVESLSTIQPDVLFQRLPAYFKMMILISSNMYGILQEKYYNIGNSVRYLVQTQSQERSCGIKLPEVHGISK